MSGAERLREAAAVLERSRTCEDPWTCCIHPTPQGSDYPDEYPPSAKDRDAAALLRTVAARPAHDTATGTGDHATDCRLCAALTLAQTILGSPERVTSP